MVETLAHAPIWHITQKDDVAAVYLVLFVNGEDLYEPFQYVKRMTALADKPVAKF